MKSKRIESGRYLVTDACAGSFMVWHEKDDFDEAPRRWFVNYFPDVLGETMVSDGFTTKWEAMRWLNTEVTLGVGWWCRKCEKRTETHLLQGGLCEGCR